MPHRVTIDAQGNLRVEIHLNGSPRNGEYHQYNRTGQLTEQGFPVLNGNQQTQYRYVVDRANSTWMRTGGTNADGVFQHGKVEVTGVGNGQIKLVSSTAKEVQVFERRWLPGGEIMDSFRKTDTLGFGNWNRRTTWATYDNAGGISNWGKREFDTSGFSWRDVDHNGRGGAPLPAGPAEVRQPDRRPDRAAGQGGEGDHRSRDRHPRCGRQLDLAPVRCRRQVDRVG